MKKIYLSLIVTLLVLLTACSGGSSSQITNSAESENQSSGSSKSKDDEIVIGYSNLGTALTTFTNRYEETFKAYAKELGVKTIVLDSQNDTVKQLNNIDNLIQQQVDVIVVWPVDGKAVIPGIKKAHDAGIPVLTTLTYVDESGFEYIAGGSSGNNVRISELSAELLIEALDGKGNIVDMTGPPGYPTTYERTNAIKSVFEKKSDIKLLDSQPIMTWSVDESQSVMENFLTKFQDIDGVITHSDTIAAGAINALEAAGRLDDVKVVSYSLFSLGYDNVKAGKMYGATLQDPNVEAKTSVDLAIKVAQGEQIEKINDVETPVITKENIDEIEKPNW